MRSSTVSAVMVSAIGLGAFAWVACGDSSKRPLGSACDSDEQCASGLCLAEQCLDPEADDDLDGLINKIEAQLGTNPTKADTDADGKPDGAEVGVDLSSPDTDGDGIPDALESASEDADSDCIADELDVHNTTPDPSDASAEVCPHVGVCGAPEAVLVAACKGAEAPKCVTAGIPGFEATEAACDGKDNDCDGATDEACAPDDPLAVGLVGRWNLDGDGVDAGPGHHDGTVVGAVAGQDRFHAASGALCFQADGDRVDIPASGHPLGEVTITYAMWVKPSDDLGATGGVLTVGDVGSVNMRSSVTVGGARNCATYNGEQNDLASPKVCAPNEMWSFLVVTKDARHVRGYLDGRLVAEGDTKAGQDVENDDLVLGLTKFAEGAAVEQFHGCLDDVRVWSRVLSDAEIAGLFGDSGWGPVGTENHPGASCQHIRDAAGATANGPAFIDPDGDAGAAPFQVYCDQTMDGGGWTLAWVYGFTHPEDFTNNDNAVTPRPGWPAPGATVPVSTTAPASPTTPGAIDWQDWRLIGSEVAVISDLQDGYACTPGSGSLVHALSGSVNCRQLTEVTSTCDGTLPNNLWFAAYGPSFNASSLYTYFDGNTGDNWPTHDPCGLNTPQQKPGVTSPRGAIYLRSADVPIAWPRSCRGWRDNGGVRRVDGTYRVDPDGAGPYPPFRAQCLFSAERGGWTRLDPAAYAAAHAFPDFSREYLFVKGADWYRSPMSTTLWDWDVFSEVRGDWVFQDAETGAGVFTCKGGMAGDWGVGCGVVQAQVLPRTTHDEDAATTTLCQSPPDIFGSGDSCTDDVAIYARATSCPTDPGSMLGDGALDDALADPGAPRKCWNRWGPQGEAPVFTLDASEAPPGGAPPSLAVDNPTAGNFVADVVLNQGELSFVAGRAYHLSFWAKAAEPRFVRVFVQTRDLSHAFYWEDIVIGAEWQQYDLAFDADMTSWDAMIDFQLADFSTARVWLDDVALRDAGPSPCGAANGDLVGDGGFAAERTCWRIGLDSHAVMPAVGWDALEGGPASGPPSFSASDTTAANAGQISLRQGSRALTAGNAYRLTFWARAAAPRFIDAHVQAWDEGKSFADRPVPIGTEWARHTLDFAARDSTEAAYVELDFGDATGAAVWVDDVSLLDLGADSCALGASELVADVGFPYGAACWAFETGPGVRAEAFGDPDEAASLEQAPSLAIAQEPPTGPVDPWSVHLVQRGKTIVAGHGYHFTFWAKAAGSRTIVAGVGAPEGQVVPYQTVSVDDAWRFYDFVGVAAASSTSGEVGFALGDGEGVEVWLDDVVVSDLGADYCAPDPGSLIANGNFSKLVTACWEVFSQPGFTTITDRSSMAPTVDAGPSLHVHFTPGTQVPSDIGIIQRGLTILANHSYRLSYWVLANGAMAVGKGVGDSQTSFLGGFDDVTAVWKQLSFVFDATGASTPGDSSLQFQFGNIAAYDVWIDEIKLEDLGPTP